MVQRARASDIALKYLRVQLCSGIGPIRFRNLMRELGGIDEILQAPVAALRSVENVGESAARALYAQRGEVDVDGQIALAEQHDCRILCLADEAYPAALRMIPDPPICIFVRGELRRDDGLALAIVGSRHCSRYGAEQAERFAALAAGAGLCVISGLARGVDTHAHMGALAVNGRTIAVMGCGLAHVDCRDARELPARIIPQGALVSELPMQIPPDAKNFPARNRIIVGLSLGVLVVEAARRSGALISARLAADYNREVFAIPGRIDAPYSEGVHDLIKHGGAKLVTCLPDILGELGEAGELLMPQPSEAAAPAQGLLFEPDETQARILAALEHEALPLEAICEATGLAPAQVASTLVGLQLKGALNRHAGDIFEIRRRG